MSVGIMSIIIQSLMLLYIIWVLFKSNAEMTEKCKDITEITERILAKDEKQEAN